MNSLFGYEIEAPVYKVPVTTKERAQKRALRVADRIKRKSLPEFNPANFDLSSFPRPDIQSAFVGQNLYIKPSYVVSMPEYCFFDRDTGEVIDRNPRTLTADFLENQKNLLNNDTTGKLSKKAVTGLRNSINWLCLAARKKRVFVRKENKSFFFKINFVTLTLPDTESHINSQDLQKQLLNPFLVYMRKYQGLKNYVWRLEFQANGKLHVHLTADTFLNHRVVRDTWNRLLDKYGYLKIYHQRTGGKDPNSTDVHSTRKIKNMAAYLAKYMSKKGSQYELPEKRMLENINKAVLAGVGEKQIKVLHLKLQKCKAAKVKPLGAMNWKGWYFQRLNFWNSPFNPRPIIGRVWGCSAGLSAANKVKVHVPASECASGLKCFMRSDIQYREIFSPPPKNTNILLGALASTEPKKIGEVFFLTASDWLTKITGVVREAFEEAKLRVSGLSQCLNFELV